MRLPAAGGAYFRGPCSPAPISSRRDDRVSQVCENCAGEDEELVPVWPEEATGDEPELWCAECRSRFPNDPAEGEGEGEGEEGEEEEGA